MLAALDRSLNRLYSACGYLAAGFLALLMLLVLASILTRMAGVYVGGLTEFSGYAMAAASYFALAYTFRAGGHIRVTMLLNRLPPAARAWAERYCLTVGAGLSTYLAFYMSQLTWYSWIFEERSEGGDAILIWIPQSAAALGAIVLALCVAHALVRALAGLEPLEAAGDNAPGEAGGPE